jgi:hypothetical protein
VSVSPDVVGCPVDVVVGGGSNEVRERERKENKALGGGEGRCNTKKRTSYTRPLWLRLRSIYLSIYLSLSLSLSLQWMVEGLDRVRMCSHMSVLLGIFTVEGVRGPGGGDLGRVRGGGT